MTDWDNLEGDELNATLRDFIGVDSPIWCPEHGFDELGMCRCGERGRVTRRHDYANSVDASIRDLVPLLGDDFYWLMLFPGEAAMGWRPRPHDETKPWETETIGGKDTVLATAVARVMGKALEVRRD